MRIQKWRDAATAMENAQKLEERKNIVTSDEGRQEDTTDQGKKRQEQMLESAKLSSMLTIFWTSEEGSAARKLLGASGTFVRIAEENEGGGYGVVYIIDEFGLRQSVEAMGTWTAYTQDKEALKSKLSPASVERVAELAVRQGSTADAVMQRIYDELDAIAECATSAS